MDPGPTHPQRLLAEAAGTFGLVFMGCGAIMVDAETGRLGHVGVSAAFGLAITAVVMAFATISGAHFNPAVSLALWWRGNFSGRLVVPYISAQIAGAGAAALLLRASLGDVAELGATVPSGSAGQSFLWEVVLTAALIGVIVAIVGAADTTTHLAALIIGGTIALAALVGGPISGASLNPARTLGPVIAGGSPQSLWVYLTAPLIGAAVAVGLSFAFRAPERTTS